MPYKKSIQLVSLILLSLVLHTQGHAQGAENIEAGSGLRIGAGYYGENLIHPGMILEFEYNRAYTPLFSLPLRASLAYHVNEGYHATFLEVQKGFRKSFPSGFFLEQGLGAGIMVKKFRTEMWYTDKFYNNIPHGNHLVAGFMPSVNIGAGYDLSDGKDGSSLLWVRPKVYWDLGFRGLHQPYFALQLGYSHTIKKL